MGVPWLTLLAADPPAAPPKGPDFLTVFGPPLLIMLVLMYFLMIRPQKKQLKEREDLLGGLKKNDHVLTSGGIFGIVDRVGDAEVVLKVDERNDVKIRVAKSAIANVIKPSGEKPADAGAPAEGKSK